jgi:hypothetical protein
MQNFQAGTGDTVDEETSCNISTDQTQSDDDGSLLKLKHHQRARLK